MAAWLGERGGKGLEDCEAFLQVTTNAAWFGTCNSMGVNSYYQFGSSTNTPLCLQEFQRNPCIIDLVLSLWLYILRSKEIDVLKATVQLSSRSADAV